MFSLFRKKLKTPEPEMSLDLEPGWEAHLSMPNGGDTIPAYQPREPSFDQFFAAPSAPYAAPPVPPADPKHNTYSGVVDFDADFADLEAELRRLNREDWTATASTMFDGQGLTVTPEVRALSIEQLVNLMESQHLDNKAIQEQRQAQIDRQNDASQEMVRNQYQMINAMESMATAIERGNTAAQAADFVRDHPILAGFLGTMAVHKIRDR